MSLLRRFFVLCIASNAAAVIAQPAIPVGLDAYRQWDRWPMKRIGVRAYMRSTYDRTGGNRSADASHFLYQLADDNNVTLDVEGNGILYFARYNHWHGSPWRYVVDGNEFIIQETSSADPLHPVANSVFLPEKLFPTPLTFTWSQTKGADLMWVPIAFEKSFRMGYSRTRYGTGYYIYHLFAPGAKLTQSVRAWDAKTAPDKDVLDLISRAGTDIAPANRKRIDQDVDAGLQSGKIVLNVPGPSQIRRLALSVDAKDALAFGRARIRITWDDANAPSVDAPIALFFGSGILYNRDRREYLVKGFPMNIRYATNRVELACYYPMPLKSKARIDIIPAAGEKLPAFNYTHAFEPLTMTFGEVGYFHATYSDHPNPKRGEDMVLLDTKGVEGSAEWSGSFVGMSWTFSDRAVLNTLEGDPRFFFDDAETPQAYGTGTEEWGGGGDYWGGLNMTLPFAGHPVGARNLKEAKSDEDKIESAYRFLLADLMPFGKRAVIRLEHGGVNESTEHYQAVVYWYGSKGATLVKTDELKIGDATSEKAHRYQSPQASAPYEITSRFEWGPDSTASNVVVYPAHTDTGRKTTGASEFTLKIDSKNAGVMLRRKLDYSFPNQRAEVFIQDGNDWKPAGIWYLAGSNTCVYSDAKGELGETQHNVITSNRRFRDDEFLLPIDLTRGKEKIRVRVNFTPVERPLFPGRPIGELAWSEIRYDVFSFVLP